MPSAPLPERLRAARTGRQLTQTAVSKQTGIGTSSLSEFENGTREPSLDQLQVLATLYQRSLSWMLGEADPTSGEVIVLWRQRPPADQASIISAEFLKLCEQFRNLELWCGVDGECRLPDWTGSRNAAFHAYDAALLAKSVRSQLEIGDRPGEGLLRTLEEFCRVKVFHLSFGPSGTAACTRSATLGACMLLNKNNAPWRRSFDSAHELFHLLTWQRFRSELGDPQVLADEREESLANIFASNLLMPEEPFRLAVQSRMGSAATAEMEQVYAVAREFCVSVDAVLVRMKQLNGMTDSEAAGLGKQWQAWRAVLERRSPMDPPKLPDRYQALALTALRRGEVSIGKYAEYMGISRHKALEIAGRQEMDGDQESSPAPA